MKAILKGMLAAAVATIATQAAAQVIFYESPDFGGRSFKVEGPVANFERFGFNDRASSVIVLRERWEACEDARFAGRGVVLRPGRYPSLAALGMNNSASSARPVSRTVRVEETRYAPPPPVLSTTTSGAAVRSCS